MIIESHFLFLFLFFCSIQSADGLMGTAPFPFVERPPNLPGLTSTDLMALRSGERVQKQVTSAPLVFMFAINQDHHKESSAIKLSQS